MLYQPPLGRIDNNAELLHILHRAEWIGFIFQGIDFTLFAQTISTKLIKHCLFLGCILPAESMCQLAVHNHIIGNMPVPYPLFRAKPYQHKDLFDAFDSQHPESYQQCYDYHIYKHFRDKGTVPLDIEENLARTLHDFSMRIAIQEVLHSIDPEHIHAVMGGHALARGSEAYIKVATLSKRLTEAGRMMLSGGGPGAMEATHLGAWMAGRPQNDLSKAIEILAAAPTYQHPLWLVKAYEVLHLYPESRYRSLSIPTWMYGHEPPTPFASDICKLFDNSQREEGLLALAIGGIIFAPGSAGTMQEVFQDLAQNHYKSYGKASPMIFLDQNYWNKEVPLYPLLTSLQQQERLGAHVSLHITDSINQIEEILLHPSRK